VQVIDRGLDGVDQALALIEVVVDLVDHHFGVGLGGEFVALLALLETQCFVIFDYAVVHNCYRFAADVGVGVGL